MELWLPESHKTEWKKHEDRMVAFKDFMHIKKEKCSLDGNVHRYTYVCDRHDWQGYGILMDCCNNCNNKMKG